MLMSRAHWNEMHMQLFYDLIRSKDGKIGANGSKLVYRGQDEKQFVKLYCTNPDLTYSDSMDLPRMSG